MPADSKPLRLARSHLLRVQAAWDEPTDWTDLTTYGLYALEAAVLAAAGHVGQQVRKTHWHKRDVAAQLHTRHGLPDVSGLMDQLNESRKGFAYGDEEHSEELVPEDIARTVEDYVEAVAQFLRREAP